MKLPQFIFEIFRSIKNIIHGSWTKIGFTELMELTNSSKLMGCWKYLNFIRYTGCPRKNATDLNNSNGSCFILIGKQLFLLKSTTIRINFFGVLVVKIKISKVQNCFQVETRAAALAIVD